MKRWMLLSLGVAVPCGVGHSAAAAVPKAAACQQVVIEGEVESGHEFSRVFGGGLRMYLQPIHSGWIVRVLPATGATGTHDYAEVATPPYQSVTPLSLSTDFAFRAQDAVGWNPRRFRFATSAEAFARLETMYESSARVNAMPAGAGRAEAEQKLQAALAADIGKAAEGVLTIVDARLVPGTADQWAGAAAVASHFSSTAHAVVEEPDHSTGALGRLVWVRFHVQLDVPAGFRAASGVTVMPRNCGTP